MREFAFFLEAWYYCQRNKIPLEQIYRKDWKTWAIKC